MELMEEEEKIGKCVCCGSPIYSLTYNINDKEHVFCSYDCIKHFKLLVVLRDIKLEIWKSHDY